MQKIILKIHKKLISQNKTIAVAESCSGGLLSHYLTSSSGSSQYFKGAIVAYSDALKTSLLKVPPSIIKRYGSVSEPVAILMAKNIRKIAEAHFGIGITGIAGPTGAKPNKPVGLIYIAVAAKNKVTVKKLNFRGGRLQIKQKVVNAALSLLLQVASSK